MHWDNEYNLPSSLLSLALFHALPHIPSTAVIFFFSLLSLVFSWSPPSYCYCRCCCCQRLSPSFLFFPLPPVMCLVLLVLATPLVR
ncbi:hypothetical protein ABB37_08318 [Leptomonas pyrrhocoris]|uniref:Uncharacterized protein n=1 Tax=Leptomonas pyrrhocoris TaxID=157538 RepID=A0A0M9FTN0_LEPPY|nr:hypothetical protein ABB37_08318 [Leptomonas pyrrhocoris]KPA75793.1 hypothetical protein ABB37_08318 [Leptomonas pyrrhocoris]|eukprot:XP_015654232.1 hypothetical protein ABB37_08318 [Leptomonas pyrrhocoris]